MYKVSDQRLKSRINQDFSIQPQDDQPHLTPASILITLHEEDGQDWLLFTKRTDLVRHHKGQISFPGGKYERGVDPDLSYTALRETREEIGIQETDVTLLGSLDPFPTITNYLVYPFVGRFNWPYELKLNPGEIAEIIRVPLEHLVNPYHQRKEQMDHRGDSHEVHFFDYPPYTIWGITGYILRVFLDQIQSSGE